MTEDWLHRKFRIRAFVWSVCWLVSCMTIWLMIEIEEFVASFFAMVWAGYCAWMVYYYLKMMDIVPCSHSSFAMVTRPSGEECWQLRCYNCGEAMPFFFYTLEEWDAISRGRE